MTLCPALTSSTSRSTIRAVPPMLMPCRATYYKTTSARTFRGVAIEHTPHSSIPPHEARMANISLLCKSDVASASGHAECGRRVCELKCTIIPFSAFSALLQSTFCTNTRAVLEITMSFGFGVGDFIAAIELTNKIRKEFIDAPGQFEDISDEYEILSNY
jgi:hypothetical protein